MCLKHGDKLHYNQCQTQLYYLYSQGFKGHRLEFIMYRIVYMVLSDSNAELEKFLQELTTKDLLSRQINFALNFLESYKSGNLLRILTYMVNLIRKNVDMMAFPI